MFSEGTDRENNKNHISQSPETPHLMVEGKRNTKYACREKRGRKTQKL